MQFIRERGLFGIGITVIGIGIGIVIYKMSGYSNDEAVISWKASLMKERRNHRHRTYQIPSDGIDSFMRACTETNGVHCQKIGEKEVQEYHFQVGGSYTPKKVVEVSVVYDR